MLEPAVLTREEVEEERDEPHRWLEAHRCDLVALRQLGRQWGARTHPDEMPPVGYERQCIDIARRDQPPRAVELAFVAGAEVSAINEPILAGQGRVLSEAWRLLGRPPSALPAVVENALQIVTPLQLALAVSAWEPSAEMAGIYRLTTQRELSQMRERVADARKRLKAVRAVVDASQPATEVRLDKSGAPSVVLSVDGHLTAAAMELEVRARGLERSLRYRSKRATPEREAVESVERREGPAEKLSPMIETAMKQTRSRWWGPVAAALKSHDSYAWTSAQLAELVLADAWFTDLIPTARAWYDDRRAGGSLTALQALIRRDLHPPTSAGSRRSVTRRPRKHRPAP